MIYLYSKLTINLSTKEVTQIQDDVNTPRKKMKRLLIILTI